MDPILFGLLILFLAPWVYDLSPIAWVVWVIAIALVALLVESLKRLIGSRHRWSQRPQGACACDLWEHTKNADASASGQPGFPSGHAAVSAFLIASLYILTRAPSVLLIGLPWVLWVVVSRLQKHCHTVPQVVAGGLVGAGFAALLAARD